MLLPPLLGSNELCEKQKKELGQPLIPLGVCAFSNINVDISKGMFGSPRTNEIREGSIWAGS
jgi:hypothetical protein